MSARHKVKPLVLFQSLRLKYKLMIFCFVIILLPILSIGIIFTSRLSTTLREENISDDKNSVALIKENLENSLKIIEGVSDSLYVNNTINMALVQKYQDPAYSIENYISSLYPTLSNTKFIYATCITNIIIYTQNETIMPNGDELQFATQAIRSEPWYKKTLSLKGKIFWSDSFEKPDSKENKAYGFSLYRAMNSFSTEPIILQIDVREDNFYSLLNNNNSSGKKFYITNPNGDIISSNDRSVMGKPAAKIGYLKNALTGDNGLYNAENNHQKLSVAYDTCVIDELSQENWKVISVVPVDNQYRGIYNARNFGILICLVCCLAISSIFIFLFSEGITLRVGKLLEKTKFVAEGNFEQIVDITGNDEIAELGVGFNKMLVSLNELINVVYENKLKMQEYEIKKKGAELNALQNQINPHFLYNTLDAMRMHAVISDDNELADMLITLSSLLRYSISRGREIVTIADEINHVENYMKILNMRYANNITLNIRMLQELYGCKIQKLVLQPIVENAFYHGLMMKREDRVIEIIGSMNDEGLIIEIVDNGVGMDSEKVELLNSELQRIAQNENSGPSIGLNNVNSRIKLYFGMEYGITISSAPGKGTCVRLLLPVQKEG